MFAWLSCSFSLWNTRWHQQYAGLQSSLFISTRKKKVSLIPLVEEGGLFFPEDSEKVFDWVIYSSMNQSVVRISGCRDFFGPIRPIPGRDSITPNTRTEHREERSLPGSQRSGKWCWEATIQCLPPSSLFSLLLFLAFFPSILYGKFCAQSRGYKHENIFPALEAL